MHASFVTHVKRLFLTLVVGAGLVGIVAGTAHAGRDDEKVLLKGTTTASYYWASPSTLTASGKPLEKGLFASPSWPLGTEGYVIYKGKKAKFYIGDRGPGVPSNYGIMLDIDAKTFAELTGGTFNPRTQLVTGNGGLGHIKVTYVITKWGEGVGKKDHPVPFSTGAWGRMDHNPAKPPSVKPAPEKTAVAAP